MTHLAENDIGAVLDNYADAIEGGNSYRGSGTSYEGIPGRHSNDEGLRTGSDGSVTASSNGTTTTIVYASGSWVSTRWVKADTPAFFAICLTATNPQNPGKARRITGWNNTTKTFTVDAFPQATTSGDTFVIQQGFKRMPEGEDIEVRETKGGRDRMFSFKLEDLPGEDIDLRGGGTATYRVPLILLLRILKYGRELEARQSAFANMAILAEGLRRGANRGGIVRMLLPQGAAEELTDDSNMIVLGQRFELTYRLLTTYAS